MKEKDRKELIGLVDVSILMHQIRQSTKQGDFLQDLLSNLRGIKNNSGVDRLCLIGDNGVSSFRKEIYPEYKEQREETRSKMSDAQKDRFKDMKFLYSNFNMFKDVLCYVDIPNVECDDICGILYKELTEEGHQVILISADKDFYTAVPAKDLFDVNTYKSYDVENKLKGLSQVKFKIYQTVFGDQTDSIRGVAGEKTAVILAKNFKTFKAMQDFDVANVLDLEGVTTKNKSYVIKALNAIKEDVDLKQIKLNWELISIFTDRSKLNKKQVDRFIEIKDYILNWECTYEINEELEEFLWSNNWSHLIPELEQGV